MFSGQPYPELDDPVAARRGARPRPLPAGRTRSGRRGRGSSRPRIDLREFGHHVRRRVPRAVHVQPARPPAAARPPRRLRPRPRQPVPRLRPARDDGRGRLAGALHAAPPDHRRPRPRPRARHQRVPAVHAAALVRLPRHADAASRARSRASSPCRRTASATSSRRWASTADRLHIVPVGVDPEIFRPLPAHRARARPPDDHHELRRADEGPRRRCSRRWPRCAPSATTPSSSIIGKPKEQEQDPRRSSSGSGSSDAVRVRVAASPPSASSSSTPRPRSPSCRRSTRASRSPRSRRWPAACRSSPPPAARCPRSSAPHGETGLLVPPGDPDALGEHAAPRAAATPTCAPGSARPAAPRALDNFTWRPTALGTVEHYRALLDAAGARRRRRSAQMLTVDFDRLDLRPGSACSTWAAAAAGTRSRRCAAARPSSRSTTTSPSSRRCGDSWRR